MCCIIIIIVWYWASYSMLDVILKTASYNIMKRKAVLEFRKLGEKLEVKKGKVRGVTPWKMSEVEIWNSRKWTKFTRAHPSH